MLTTGARTRKALWQPGVGAGSLAAGAGEDRAALGGRPRKANAGQYVGAMPQRNQKHRAPFSRMYWWA